MMGIGLCYLLVHWLDFVTRIFPTERGESDKEDSPKWGDHV